MTRAIKDFKPFLAVQWRAVPFLCILFCFCPGQAQPGRNVQLAVGEVQVLSVSGTVRLLTTAGGSVSGQSQLSSGMTLTTGDRIKTATGSFVTLGLPDQSKIEIQPDTDLEILDFSGGLRQLLRIWLGRVRLKIHHLVGAPNPYEMHSPIATIGVRGTEFEIRVDPNQVTTVRVFDGVVSVRNRQIESREVLVTAGREVTVHPLRQPDSPVAFERIVAQNFIRESAVGQPHVGRFLAFPDPHLDFVDNPAYASLVHQPSGRLYVFPARSETFMRPDISPLSPIRRVADVRGLFATDQRVMGGLSTQLSYARPVGDWVLGGLYGHQAYGQDFEFKISRQVQTAFGDTVSIEQVGGNRFAPNLNLSSTDQRVVVLAARRFAGQTIAFSYDWARSNGNIDTRYALLPNGVPLTSESARTRFTNVRRQIVFGYHKQSDSIGSLGLFYRVGSFSGNTGQTEHLLDQQPAPLARFTDGGISQETGIRWRKRLHRNFSIGVVSSLQHARLNGVTRDYRIADSDGKRRYWVPRVGAGVGGTFAGRFQYSIDYHHSFVLANSWSQQVSDRSLISDERVRRTDHTLHSWLQVQLPASFFAGGGLTSFWSAEEFKGNFEIDSEGRRRDSQGQPRPAFVKELSLLQLTQPGFSVGRRFGDSFFLQYFLSSTIGPQFRPTSHSVLLRFAF